MPEGFISRVIVDKCFGFIKTPNQPDCFFHMSDITDEELTFDETLLERRVRYDVVNTDKGLRAKNLRAA